MKAYRPLAIAAGNARTDEESLLEFGRAGWIEVIFKDQRPFISSQTNTGPGSFFTCAKN